MRQELGMREKKWGKDWGGRRRSGASSGEEQEGVGMRVGMRVKELGKSGAKSGRGGEG